MVHDDYWFNYVIGEDPIEIKQNIREEYILSKDLNIHLDIYEDENTTNKTIIFQHGNSVYGRFYAENKSQKNPVVQPNSSIGFLFGRDKYESNFI